MISQNIKPGDVDARQAEVRKSRLKLLLDVIEQLIQNQYRYRCTKFVVGLGFP